MKFAEILPLQRKKKKSLLNGIDVFRYSVSYWKEKSYDWQFLLSSNSKYKFQHSGWWDDVVGFCKAHRKEIKIAAIDAIAACVSRGAGTIAASAMAAVSEYF